MRHLTQLATVCRITTLELRGCDINGQDTGRLAEVLTHCPSLTHLDVSFNFGFGEVGTERFPGVLGQYREHKLLDLTYTRIDTGGVCSLARVLGFRHTKKKKKNFLLSKMLSS
jgi:hypothetical protein